MEQGQSIILHKWVQLFSRFILARLLSRSIGKAAGQRCLDLGSSRLILLLLLFRGSASKLSLPQAIQSGDAELSSSTQTAVQLK